MKKALMLGFIVLVLLSLGACAAGPNEMKNTENQDGEVAGFFKGLY